MWMPKSPAAWQVLSINASGTYNLDCKPEVPPVPRQKPRPHLCLFWMEEIGMVLLFGIMWPYGTACDFCAASAPLAKILSIASLIGGVMSFRRTYVQSDAYW